MKTTTRFIALIALFFVAGLTACSDGPTQLVIEEVEEALPQVVVMTITLANDTSRDYGFVQIAFGNSKSDSLSFLDGQEPLADWNPVISVITSSGESATLLAAVTTGRVLDQKGDDPPSFQFLSDWEPVEPELHLGVKVTSFLEFLTMSWDKETGVEFPRVFERRLVSGRNPSAIIELPNKPNAFQFVQPRHKFEIICLGDDILTFRSPQGLYRVNIDRFGRRVYGPYPAQEATVACTLYTSVTAAQEALMLQGLAFKMP